MASRELRAYGIISRMQPRYAAYEATVADGDIPLAGMAQLFVEIAPGNEIYLLADAALKATNARPSSQVVEREFGMLSLHADDPQEVAEAGRVILERIGLTIEDRLRPTVVSQNLITNVTPFQAQLINRFRKGSLLVPQRNAAGAGGHAGGVRAARGERGRAGRRHRHHRRAPDRPFRAPVCQR